MHIMIVIYAMQGGGAERATAHLSRLWVEAGHRVSIVSLGAASGVDYVLHPAVAITPLHLAQTSNGARSAISNNIRRLAAIRALMRRAKPDIAIGMMSTTNVLVALAGLGLPTRTLAAERIYPPAERLSWAWRQLQKYAYGVADLVTAQTDVASDWLRAKTLARRVVTIPNPVRWPVPDSEPELEPNALVDADSKIVLAAGRLCDQKGFIHLVNAFARTRQPLEGEWRLVILGEGPDRAALTDRIQALGLEDRILLPGRAGNMATWYKRASLFVLSSLYEGFPNVLLEAMASGAPVISFDCAAGPRDIIETGVDGLLVPPGDERALAAAMNALMRDDAARASMGQRAKAVQQKFSETRILEEWDRAFRLAGMRGAP